MFDLNSVGMKLFSKKVADIKAPANASAGLAGTGAVDWLTLVAVDGMGSVGLSQVYRVDTAGGNPLTDCSGLAVGDVLSVPYSAAYHFYG